MRHMRCHSGKDHFRNRYVILIEKLTELKLDISGHFHMNRFTLL